VIKKMVALT